jgi:hypothetical protein
MFSKIFERLSILHLTLPSHDIFYKKYPVDVPVPDGTCRSNLIKRNRDLFNVENIANK